MGMEFLLNSCKEFHDVKINLTKLESRPAKKGTEFKYVFYIDFEGHYLSNNFQIIFKRYEDNIKLLGSYPKDDLIIFWPLIFFHFDITSGISYGNSEVKPHFFFCFWMNKT